MKIPDSLKSEYTQELDDFYNGVDQLQEGLLQMAQTACAAELRPEFEYYLEQMRDLGHRLERIFSLVNEKSLRITCKSMDEVSEELHELIELACGHAASDRGAGRGAVTSSPGVQKEKEALKWILGLPSSIECDITKQQRTVSLTMAPSDI